ncbi:MAG: efflux RND transporter periplasmic adaptor subunit [Rhodothalassiaceae bacterium]
MTMSRRQLYAALAVAATVVLGVAFLARSDAPDRRHGFESAVVERGDIEQVVATTGSVRPLVTVQLGSQVSGQVAELRADFNDEVKQGQVVAVIDPRTFAARVEQAAADLKLAEAGLASARAAIARARASLVQAERDYERNRKLAQGGNLSASALDAAEAALAVARADLSAAEAQRVTAEATIEQRRAALEQARIDLARTEIRSPIDGVIVNRVVDVGQTVAASLSAPVLFEIAQDLRSIQIEASVDEADIGGVRPGNPVRFGVDAYPEQHFSGVVKQVRLAPVELQNVVTYTVIIADDNPDRRLLPGMTANLEIVTGSAKDVLRVPNAALRFRPQAPVAEAAAPASTGSGAGRQGLAEMAERLALDAAQRKKLAAAMRDLRAGFRRQFPGGGGAGPAAPDPEALRARFQAQLEKALGEILTPKQMARYADLAREREQLRVGRVYVEDKTGKRVARRVLLGVSDNRFTEIRRGLAEGDRVITRETAGDLG